MSETSKGITTRKVRQQNAERAFKFVINELFEQELDEDIALSLYQHTNNKADIRMVIDMTGNSEAINDLHYIQMSTIKDEKGVTPVQRRVELSKGYKGLVKRLLDYNIYRINIEDPINDDWSNVDPDAFKKFRITIPVDV